MQQAADFRRLALDERALVEASPLAHVRAKHELAAARWDGLADQAERVIAAHHARVRVAPPRRSASRDGLEPEAGDPDTLIPDGV